MEQKRFLKPSDIACYSIAFHLSNYVWDLVIKWDIQAKKTVGEQFVDAMDSIPANIAEGFERYHKKDKIKFYRYSRGFMLESSDWNQKVKIRNLISNIEYDFIFGELQKLPKAINSLILFTNQKLKN